MKITITKIENGFLVTKPDSGMVLNGYAPMTTTYCATVTHALECACQSLAQPGEQISLTSPPLSAQQMSQ